MCSERLALSSDGATLVVGKTRMPVPQADRPGEVLLVDTATGDVLRACRSLYLRFVVLVASQDAKLDCRWLGLGGEGIAPPG